MNTPSSKSSIFRRGIPIIIVSGVQVLRESRWNLDKEIPWWSKLSTLALFSDLQYEVRLKRTYFANHFINVPFITSSSYNFFNLSPLCNNSQLFALAYLWSGCLKSILWLSVSSIMLFVVYASKKKLTAPRYNVIVLFFGRLCHVGSSSLLVLTDDVQFVKRCRIQKTTSLCTWPCYALVCRSKGIRHCKFSPMHPVPLLPLAFESALPN